MASAFHPIFYAKMKTIKAHFVDRAAIKSAISRVALRRLARIGGMTRTIARNAMKKQRERRMSEMPAEITGLISRLRAEGKLKKRQRPDIQPWPVNSAKPSSAENLYGEAPRYRERRSLKDAIFFAAIPDEQSVVIGPSGNGRKYKSTNTPELLEHGGRRSGPIGEWNVAFVEGEPVIRLEMTSSGTVTYKGHHFMERSLAIAYDRLMPDLWKDSVR